MSRFSLLVAVSLMLASSSTVFAREYPIRLTRPVSVGQRNVVTITSTRLAKSTATINGQEQTPEEQSVTVTLTGVVEVLQVSRKGTPLIEEYSVDKCTLTEKGKTVELLKKGTVVQVKANYEGPIIEVEGQDVSEDELEMVSELFVLNATEITDDDVYGSKTPRSPGATWNLNVANATKLAKTSGVVMEDVTGTTTFVGVKPASGTNCLEITTTLSAGKMVPPDDVLPPKFTATKSTFKSTSTGLYPEDGKSLPVLEKVTEDMTRIISGTNANRQKIVSTTVSRRIREIKRGGSVAKPAPQVGTSKTKPKS